MIFVTVGTQFPFERLVSKVDDWAKSNSPQQVFAQIGETDFVPKHIKFAKKLTPKQFDDHFDKAKVIVSHAGMGTIISSLLANKPIIVFARDADKNEHRNQHQFSTCKKFEKHEGCYVANSEGELIELLNRCSELEAGCASTNNIDFGNALTTRIVKLAKN